MSQRANPPTSTQPMLALGDLNVDRWSGGPAVVVAMVVDDVEMVDDELGSVVEVVELATCAVLEVLVTVTVLVEPDPQPASASVTPIMPTRLTRAAYRGWPRAAVG